MNITKLHRKWLTLIRIKNEINYLLHIDVRGEAGVHLNWLKQAKCEN